MKSVRENCWHSVRMKREVGYCTGNCVLGGMGDVLLAEAEVARENKRPARVIDTMRLEILEMVPARNIVCVLTGPKRKITRDRLRR